MLNDYHHEGSLLDISILKRYHLYINSNEGVSGDSRLYSRASITE